MKIYKSSVSTFIGDIDLYADNNYLLFVEFAKSLRKINKQIEKLFSSSQYEIIDKKSKIIENAIDELISYFKSSLKVFKTPLKPIFRRDSLSFKVVHTLLDNVRFGSTISYKDLSKLSGIKNGARFVGNVMSKNNLPIFIPCHRVIKSDGKIGDYSGSTDIKMQLINFERRCIK